MTRRKHRAACRAPEPLADATSSAIPVTPLEDRIAEARGGKGSASPTALLMGDPSPAYRAKREAIALGLEVIEL